MSPARRTVLRTVAALTVGGSLAGCQSGDDDDGNDTTTAAPTGTTTPEKTPAEGTPDDETPTDPQEPAQLKQQAREFVQLLADGEFETAHAKFTESTASQLSATQLEQAWAGTAGQKGDLVEILSAEYRGESNGQEVVVVRAQFTEGTQQFTFGFVETGISTFRIVPDRQDEWTAPEYADESAFSEREVTLSAPGDCSLGATLTMPDGEGDVPGVVLVHGNGQQDRDQTVGPNKTFKDITWGLATQGIAVLRYDKRTAACDVDLADVTIDDVATDDALTAIERLRGVDRVGSVFVAGHSFGGVLAPRIAARDGDLAGVVMLAPGPADSFADTIVRQTRHLAELDGTVTEAEQQAIEQVEQRAERIRTLDIGDDEVVNNFGGDEYYRTFQEYDQRETFAGLSVPRFVAQGGQDWQVTVEDDLQVWRDAAGDQAGVTIEVYPELNHRFQVSTGKATRQEYFRPDSHVAGRLVEDVATFVQSNA